MTRRTVAVVAWLVTALLNAMLVWTVVDGGFLESIFARLPIEQRAPAQGMVVVTYAVMAEIIAVTLAYATVGLLLASQRGGGRVGAILLAGGAALAAVPFGYMVGGTLALRNPLDPVAGVLFLVGPASITLALALILPVVALIFPDGRLPSTQWRWPTRAALGALAAATILVVLTPGEIEDVGARNPLGSTQCPPGSRALPARCPVLAPS